MKAVDNGLGCAAELLLSPMVALRALVAALHSIRAKLSVKIWNCPSVTAEAPVVRKFVPQAKPDEIAKSVKTFVENPVVM